jgi:hypothetical protein
MPFDQELFEQQFFVPGLPPLLVVLRGQLWIEAMLLDVLQEAVAQPQHLDLDRTSFGTKVRLAVSLGAMPAEAIPGFDEINRIRNRAAHNLRYEYTVDDEERLIATLDPHTARAALSDNRYTADDFPERTINVIAALVVILEETEARIIADKREAAELHERVEELRRRYGD